MSREDFGTVNERTLHAMLKLQLEPDPAFHEIPVGRFVADIKRGEEIFEIQTRALKKLLPKLEFFLQEHIVTVVYPVARYTYLHQFDPQSGEVTKPRRSPKVGTPHDAMAELWHLIPFFAHPGFRLQLIFLDVDEYRKPNGVRRGRKRSIRMERIPREIIETMTFTCRSDYVRLLPPSLSEPFTAKDYAKARKCTSLSAGYALLGFLNMGVLEREKVGQSYHYYIKKQEL